MEFLQSPVGIGAVVAGVVVLFLLLRGKSGGSSMGAPKEKISPIEKLVANGQYAEAAMLAKRSGDDTAALEYYLRARMPDQAAKLAIKLDDTKRAAEIYERAKKYERAAMMYDKSGMEDKGRDMRKLAEPAAASKAPKRGAVTVTLKTD